MGLPHGQNSNVGFRMELSLHQINELVIVDRHWKSLEQVGTGWIEEKKKKPFGIDSWGEIFFPDWLRRILIGNPM